MMLRRAWIGYFAMFPNYKIEINQISEMDSLICAFGYVSGTYKNLKTVDNRNYWRVPSACTAIIDDNLVKKWQVYVDNLIVMDIVKEINKKLFTIRVLVNKGFEDIRELVARINF